MNTTKHTATINGRKVSYLLTDIGEGFLQVSQDGRTRGYVYPSAMMTGYWAWKQQGRARTVVAMSKGRAAAVKELLAS